MIYEGAYSKRQILETTSEKDKNKSDYLVGNINYWISKLVTTKPELQLAYDYYHGIRDKAEFKYLEDNFGLGNACELSFTPLVRKHIEVLKGMFLQQPLKYHITCSDNKTINDVQQQKHYLLLTSVFEKSVAQIKNNARHIQKLKVNPKAPEPQDLLGETELKELTDYYNMHWKSLFEISAQNVIDYMLQSKSVDFKTKFVDMMEDMLVSGSAYYKGELDQVGEDPNFEVINPLHIFYNKNTNDRYINQCTAVVHRFYRTPEEIINKFGHLLSEKEVDKLLTEKSMYGNNVYDQFSHNLDETVGGFKNRNSYNNNYSHTTSGLIECYHTEWLANNKIELDDYEEMYEDEDGVMVPIKKHKYRLDRYSGYKLGSNIYIDMGKDDDVFRPVDKPWKCKLSYNGILNTDRNGIPYSLVLQTKDLQDKYDIYRFHRDNVVHHAGVKGLYVDVSLIPDHMGDSPEERQITYLQTLKQGLAIINTAQDGINTAGNTFTSFDLSLDSQTIEAYNLLINLVEETVTSITGVPRQMLGAIEQRDAVANVQESKNQTMVITKPIFHLMDSLIRGCLSDMLNLAKKSYKNGKKGSLLLGNKTKSFTIIPEYFCNSDFDIHIVDSSEVKQEMQIIQSLTMELVKAQSIAMDTAFEILTTNSLTEAKELVKRDTTSKKQQEFAQASQQVEELSKQLKESEGNIQRYEKKADKFEQDKLNLENRKLQLAERKQEEDSAIKKEIHEQTMNVKMKQIEAEVLQLTDTNKNNDEIKNI